jgi:hypothetical protein
VLDNPGRINGCQTGNPVNQYISRSEFLIKSDVLLNRKNLLKPGGFYANRSTRLSYKFSSKLIFWVSFLVFIKFKIGLFSNCTNIKKLKNLNIMCSSEKVISLPAFPRSVASNCSRKCQQRYITSSLYGVSNLYHIILKLLI